MTASTGSLGRGFARRDIAHRILILLAWLALAVAGGVAAPDATAALSYDFSLPGQRVYEANQQLVQRFGSGGDNPPVLLVVGDGRHPVPLASAASIVGAAATASPGARIASYANEPALRCAGDTTAVVLVYPRPQRGGDACAQALSRLESAADELRRATGVSVAVSGQDALAKAKGSGGAGVLIDVLFGGIGALVVLMLVVGSALAVLPLAIAAASIRLLGQLSSARSGVCGDCDRNRLPRWFAGAGSLRGEPQLSDQ